MPNVTRDLFRNDGLLFAAFSGFNVAHNGAHHIFDAANVRVNCVATPQGNGLHAVALTKNVNGDTIYLSYFTDEISSVVLTNPPLAGVNKFTTDNLSGCKVFVDSIQGTNDIIVYHANARLHSPPANHGAANPAQESLAAAGHLDALHNAAMAEYGLAA